MPEAATAPSPTSSAVTAPKSTPPKTLADSERGNTKIADSVVTKVAGIAAREVDGIFALGSSGARAIGNVTQRVGIDNRSQGVSVEVTDQEATIELTVVLEYGESIPSVTQQVRDQIVRRVESICGLTVSAVDITVSDLHFAGDDADQEQA
jgi:uncharacterized alkaline shock family protein YloU